MEHGGFRVQASLWPRCVVTMRGGRAVLARCRRPGADTRRAGRVSMPIDLAALVLDGTADRPGDDGVADRSPFIGVLLARGLRMTTDLDRIDVRPVPGWQLSVDSTTAITVRWPYRRRLLDRAPVDSPPGWLRALEHNGFVLVMAGVGLHLSDPPATDRPILERLTLAAGTDGLVVGAVSRDHPTE